MGKCTALITGITGQDGSYLAELLLEKGYEVHGLVRRSSIVNTERIQGILDKVTLHQGDMTDQQSINKVVREVRPWEVYNLAAQSFVPASWKSPEYTANVNGLGVVRLLEAIRSLPYDVKVYQASTSEMFGNSNRDMQNESTPFNPSSPYAASKLFAHNVANVYRKVHGIFVCCGILFNHESPRRGLEFVTRKITHGVARIAKGLEDTLMLGNLNARRDWGHAKDYVRAMWLMLQQDKPDDYVIATSMTWSVEDFVDIAFGRAGLDYTKHVKVDPNLLRSGEVHYLKGDYTLAAKRLGWQPEITFYQLVEDMVSADLARIDHSLVH